MGLESENNVFVVGAYTALGLAKPALTITEVIDGATRDGVCVMDRSGTLFAVESRRAQV